MIITSGDSQTKIPYLIQKDGKPLFFDDEGQESIYEVLDEESLGDSGEQVVGQSDFVKSPMPGTIVKVYVEVGQEVKANDPLISVESMKMEFLIRATHDAKVESIRHLSGSFVQIKETLITFEKQEEKTE